MRQVQPVPKDLLALRDLPVLLAPKVLPEHLVRQVLLASRDPPVPKDLPVPKVPPGLPDKLVQPAPLDQLDQREQQSN